MSHVSALFVGSSSLTKEAVHTSPTIGSNVEEIIVRNTHFLVWDIGGQESLRATWNNYYNNTEVREEHVRSLSSAAHLSTVSISTAGSTSVHRLKTNQTVKENIVSPVRNIMFLKVLTLNI